MSQHSQSDAMNTVNPPRCGERPSRRRRSLTLVGLVTVGSALAAVALGALAASGADVPPVHGRDGRATEDNTPARTEAVVTDSLGRRVSAPAEPDRIAALTAQAAEWLADLGVTPVLRPASPHQPSPDLRDAPTISIEHAAGPNLEQLVAARPDLVITSSTFAQFIPPIESATDAPALALDVRCVADLKKNIRLLGDLLGRNDKAEEFIETINANVAEAKRDAPGDGSKVFALFGAPSAFYGFLPETYLGDLVEIAGGRMVALGESDDSRYRGFTPIGLESLVAAEPDVILTVAHSGAEARLESLRDDPAWSSLRAVREGRVVSLPERLFVTAAGARFGEALDQVRDALDETGERR